MKYNVLKIIYTADRYTPGNFIVSWQIVGQADSMDEAKGICKAPVLEVR